MHVVRASRRYPDVELVYGRGSFVDNDGATIRAYDVKQFDRRLLLTRDYILQPAAFWRRGLWERVGTLDTVAALGIRLGLVHPSEPGDARSGSSTSIWRGTG